MSKYGNVRVRSDGTPMGTFVEVNGTPIDGVLSLRWDMESTNVLGLLTLTIDAAEIDADVKRVLLDGQEDSEALRAEVERLRDIVAMDAPRGERLAAAYVKEPQGLTDAEIERGQEIWRELSGKWAQLRWREMTVDGPDNQPMKVRRIEGPWEDVDE